MTKYILVMVAALALAFTVPTSAQTTNAASVAPTPLPAPAAITLPRPIQQLTPVTLDAAHSAAFLVALQTVVSIPTGYQPINGSYSIGPTGLVTVRGAVQPTAPVTTK